MKVINARNVQDAFVLGITHLLSVGEKSTSRNGDVWVAPHPVTTVYERPHERVLLSEHRDANPFFHLVESAWMLCGRNDVGPLSRIVKRMDEFADDGEIHGAYGHRWRTHFQFDQIQEIIGRLNADRFDRQCVLAMWDPGRGSDLTGEWRDRPCNTHVYFRPRLVGQNWSRLVGQNSVLDMTVCCRSNDIIWGAYGANAVHFSVLQEYVATHVGMHVGTMYQISNNFHAYADVLNKLLSKANREVTKLADLRYERDLVEGEAMGLLTDQDLCEISLSINKIHYSKNPNGWFPKSRWGEDVVRAYIANFLWKKGDKKQARVIVSGMNAQDWRVACTEWMDRREK